MIFLFPVTLGQAGKAGIPAGFTPHSLRHAFVSALVGCGVPITDVAQWVGHKDINVTYAIYGHLVPNAADRAVSVLDAEYAEWGADHKDRRHNRPPSGNGTGSIVAVQLGSGR